MIAYLYFTGILSLIITIYMVFEEGKGLKLKWYNYWIAIFWPIAVPLVYLLYFFWLGVMALRLFKGEIDD